MPDTPEQVPVRVLGGPTTLIGYGGLRVLTDPTFDAPGEYPLGGGRVLTKTAPSAVDPERTAAEATELITAVLAKEDLL